MMALPVLRGLPEIKDSITRGAVSIYQYSDLAHIAAPRPVALLTLALLS